MLRDYIVAVIHDASLADRCIQVVERMGISTGVLATAVKLYRRVIERVKAGAENSTLLYTARNDAHSYFFKSPSRKGQSFTSPSGVALENFYIMNGKKKTVADIVRDPYLLMVMCCIIAYKYLTDIPYTNDSWLPFISMGCREINHSERIILALLNYDLEFNGETAILKEIAPYIENTLPVRCGSTKKEHRRRRKIFCFKI